MRFTLINLIFSSVLFIAVAEQDQCNNADTSHTKKNGMTHSDQGGKGGKKNGSGGARKNSSQPDNTAVPNSTDNTNNSPSSESVTGVWDISTANQYKLNKKIHGTCIVAINFFSARRSGSPENNQIALNPYLALFDSLHWQIVEWTGDASAHLNRLKVNDTTLRAGNGFNCTDCEAKNAACCVPFGKDFFNENLRLMKKTRIRNFDYTVNLSSGTIDEALWACKNGATWLQGELELSTKRHVDRWPNGQSYVKEWQAYIDAIHKQYPNVVFESDAAPIWSNQPRDVEWNNALTSLKGDGSKRMYLWDDDCFTATNDWNYNISQINLAYDKTYPDRLRMMLSKFPGDSVNIAQWGMKNFQDPQLDNTMAGAHLIVKAYSLFESMTMINHAFFMSMKQLIDKTMVPTNNYKILVLAGKFVANSDMVVTTTLPDGLSGSVGVNGKTFYCLVSNQTGGDRIYPDININGTGENVVYHQITYTAASPGSMDFTRTTRNEKDILLKNNSVSLIYFTIP
ncbi:MAG: hypothetical protein H0W62_04030 [Chitinophagales bacterium]|nr:hypothetical protein [Chitinophagales bacterium]